MQFPRLFKSFREEIYRDMNQPRFPTETAIRDLLDR